MKRLLPHRWTLGALSAVATAVLVTTAVAYITVTATVSASAAVGALNPPTAVTAQQSGANVTISWGAASLSDAGAVQGYEVTRSDGTTICGSPTLDSSLSCVDTSVPPGTYTYTVTAVYNSWSSSASSAAITILTAPTISAEPSNPSASATPSFSFSGGNGSGFQCQIDGGGYSACSSPMSYSGLGNGSHTFTVRAVDGSSVGPAATYTWKVETAAPTITSEPSDPSANTSPSFSFNDDGFSQFECQLDGGALSACNSGSVSYTSLATGSHTLKVYAVGADGVQTATTTYTWSVETAAPTLSSKPSDPSANTSPSFGFNEDAFSQFECQLDSGSLTACDSGSVSYTSLATGSHTFKVYAVGADGSQTATTTYTWSVETAAPAISSEPSNPSANTSPTFNLGDDSFAEFECQLDSGAVTACNSGIVTYSNLATGSHTFQVYAVGADGSQTATTTYTWSVETAPPTISLEPSNPSSSTSPSFSFNDDSFSQFECQLDNGTLAACNSGSVSYSSLASGSHTFNVYAVGADGSQTLTTTYTWTVETALPTVITQTSGNTATIQTVSGDTYLIAIYCSGTNSSCNSASAKATVAVGSGTPFAATPPQTTASEGTGGSGKDCLQVIQVTGSGTSGSVTVTSTGTVAFMEILQLPSGVSVISTTTPANPDGNGGTSATAVADSATGHSEIALVGISDSTGTTTVTPPSGMTELGSYQTSPAPNAGVGADMGVYFNPAAQATANFGLSASEPWATLGIEIG